MKKIKQANTTEVANTATSELETQAQAMINYLTEQRNQAQNQCTNLIGQLAVLELRLKVLTPVEGTKVDA